MNSGNEKDNLLEVLTCVQEHIRLQDTKASGFLTVIGIVFSFSLFSLDTIIANESCNKFILYICGILYLLCFLISTVLLVVALFPMEKKSTKTFYPRYAIDIFRMTKTKNFNESITRNLENSEIVEQIRICSRIAFIKEKCVRISAFTIIASVALLLSIIVSLFVG